MVSGKKVQEGLSVLGPEFQLLNISGKSLAGATKTTDKGKEYQEGDICVIICVDHVGLNVETRVMRVGSEPADTTNDMIGL